MKLSRTKYRQINGINYSHKPKSLYLDMYLMLRHTLWRRFVGQYKVLYMRPILVCQLNEELLRQFKHHSKKLLPYPISAGNDPSVCCVVERKSVKRHCNFPYRFYVIALFEFLNGELEQYLSIFDFLRWGKGTDWKTKWRIKFK